MSFDRDTRNKLARMVADARRRLVTDATDSLRRLGLQDDGTLVPFSALGGLSDGERAASEALRELLAHFASLEPEGSDGVRAANAHGRLVREIGFTTLNRLVALRMAEERGLIIESVRNGFAAGGFQLFERIANGSLGSRAQTYRAYLESLYDELAVDLPSLFSRAGPESHVFPDEATLEAVLGLLNDPALAELWKEDETVGWVYQYYNDPDERRKMREGRQPPRNSRELAVRNQFFTPRYIVEFLTDNTLGRTWYEMCQGDTRLRDDCRYFVRRPTEIFLRDGESAPATSENNADLSQEELWKQPVHVPFRAKKDPRNLKILDPACGSGHFLLYAFDLLETMYEEAWSDDSSPRSEVAVCRLSDDYSSLDELRAAIPGLILRHNLHGVDIDPRAVQIAALALWLRAQASYKRLGLRPAERPRLTRANLVVAECMPGEHDLLDQFVARLDPPLIGGLVQVAFAEMQLAGEAGTLLRIEEQLRDAIRNAKVVWQRGPKLQQLALLPEEARRRSEQMELGLDTSGITDEAFWERVEERVFVALREFAAEAVHGDATRRRLFAEDSERGFGFIDMCRQRFDVVLMNPPFGEATAALLSVLSRNYGNWNKNLLCAFTSRMLELCTPQGFVGYVFDKTAAIKSTYQTFRSEVILEPGRLQTQVDLGWDVLDANVEVSAAVVCPTRALSRDLFFDVSSHPADSRPSYLLSALSTNGTLPPDAFICKSTELAALPNSIISFQFPPFMRRIFAQFPSLRDVGFNTFEGHTFKSLRHFRLRWEIPSSHPARYNSARWTPIFNGGDFSPYYHPSRDVGLYGHDGSLIDDPESVVLRNVNLHGSLSVGWGKRGEFIDARIIPPGHVFTVEGKGARVGSTDQALFYSALLNSDVFQFGINLYSGQHKYGGYVDLFPCPTWNDADMQVITAAATAILECKRSWQRADETDDLFVHPWHLSEKPQTIAGWITAVSARSRELNQLIHEETGRLNFRFRDLYHLADSEWAEVTEYNRRREVDVVWSASGVRSPEIGVTIVSSLLSYLVGVAFGRWDLRLALNPIHSPAPPAAFDTPPELPLGGISARKLLDSREARVVSTPTPGTEADQRTLLGEETPDPCLGRPFLDGVLPEDPTSTNDLVHRVQDLVGVLWPAEGDAESKLCEVLGCGGLRDYIRTNTFFADHLKRYTKSRRQAPIYWPLSTASGSYTVWLYYQRLTSDTLFAAVRRYVEPKIADVDRQLSEARNAHSSASGREASRLVVRVEELTTFLAELNDFRSELLRITEFPYRPNLDDGVIINAAPLHKLFRLPKWAKDTKDVWQKLEQGDYDWAHMAYTIWPERVREKCRSDRSLAIAHDLEHLFSGPPPSAGKRRARAATLTIDEDDE